MCANKEESKKATIRIKWVRSSIGCPEKHKRVVRGLGLRKLQQVVERPDDAAIRGMVSKIPHLVKIVD
jgi:large subunit ribosomal protein L30